MTNFKYPRVAFVAEFILTIVMVIGLVRPASGQKPTDAQLEDALWICLHDRIPTTERDITDHRKAFDPNSGRNFHYDNTKKAWIDSKSGDAICPKSTDTRPRMEDALWICLHARIPTTERDITDHTKAHDPNSGRNFFYDEKRQAWRDSKTGECICPKCPPPKPKIHLGAKIGLNYDMYAIHDDQQNKNSTGTGIGGLIGAFAVYPLSEQFSLEASLDYAINTPTFTNDESQSDQFGTTQYHSETGWGFHGFDLGVGPQFHIGGIDVFAGLKINFTTSLSLSNASTISRDGQQLASIDTTFSVESDKYNAVVPYVYAGLQYRINMPGLPFDITPSLAINIPMGDNTPSSTFGGSNKLTIVGLVVKLTWKQGDI